MINLALEHEVIDGKNLPLMVRDRLFTAISKLLFDEAIPISNQSKI